MQRHTAITVVFCSLVLFAQLLATKVAYGADSGRYSIALAAAPGVDLKWNPADLAAFEGYTLYVTQITVKKKPWERLCMGYFNTRNQAAAKLKEVRSSYRGAWISDTVPATQQRIIKSSTSRRSSSAPVTSRDQSNVPATEIRKGNNLSESQLEDLMLRAKTSIKKEDYSQAVRYLTAVVEAGEHQYSPEALELLGLARQRKGQNAHAAAIYEKYLEKYPTSEGATRVQQRLSGLITATRDPRDEIRMESDASSNRLDTFGSFSQYYRNDRATSDGIDTVTVASQLISFIDATSIARTLNYDHQFRLISDHTYDFEADEDASEFRFVEMYYDLNLKKSGSSGRIGRQRLPIGGLLRRYDGISAGYQINPDMRINLLGGYPVEIDNKTSINSKKTFYGITFETGLFFEHWEMNLFYFDQSYDGLDDGTNIGTEIRYKDKTKSIFGMIDYDTFYKEINTVQFNANLLFDHGFTAYLNAFMRKTPFISIENALIGRPEQSIEELQQNLDIEQIYQLARDRTADSENITVGGAKQLSEKFRVNADITFSRLDGTIASGGVPATPEKGTDFLISAQLVGNNLLMDRDTGVLGIRYYDTDYADTLSFIGNTRFYITREWLINPRLQYDIREISDGRSQNKLRALFRTDYRIRNLARLDFEVGYDDITDDGISSTLATNYLYFTLGYRLGF
jgi:tetratricopeptide (TPR) repeat protein